MIQKNCLINVIGALLLVLLGLILPSTPTISPNDEYYDDNKSLNGFLTELEKYSDLDKQVPDRPIEITCPDSQMNNCVVNPNGTIGWTIREQLYDEFLTKNRDADHKNNTEVNTLDGCLDRTTTEDYRTCMEEVRNKMTEWLKQNFDSIFTTELQKNCSALAGENCVHRS